MEAHSVLILQAGSGCIREALHQPTQLDERVALHSLRSRGRAGVNGDHLSPDAVGRFHIATRGLWHGQGAKDYVGKSGADELVRPFNVGEIGKLNADGQGLLEHANRLTGPHRLIGTELRDASELKEVNWLETLRATQAAESSAGL